MKNTKIGIEAKLTPFKFYACAAVFLVSGALIGDGIAKLVNENKLEARSSTPRISYPKSDIQKFYQEQGLDYNTPMESLTSEQWSLFFNKYKGK
jgi:hypothetical protein